MSTNIDVYKQAENSLVEWLELCLKSKITVPEIVFMLQFRIFDLNMNTLSSWVKQQEDRKEEKNELQSK